MKKQRNSAVIIYYDKVGKCKQIVKPSPVFDGDWYRLVQHISKSIYHHFDLV